MGIRRILIPLSLITLGIAGCEPPVPQFANSDRVNDLIPEARDGITEEKDGEAVFHPGLTGMVEEGFGTPENLVAWMKLPVDFGETNGQVAEVSADVELGANQFYVVFDDELDVQLTDKQLLLTSGEFKGTALGITSIDEETGLLTVAAEFEDSKPAAGDEFVIVGHVLQQGRQLYMMHCVHCHGTTGNGEGPTAEYLNPRPRDFRKGTFKFTSTNVTVMDAARHADLERVIRLGIPGTYMPSFLLLEDDELQAIIEYVRFLSMRGKFEDRLATYLEGEGYSEEAVKSATEGDNPRPRGEVITELLSTLKELPVEMDGHGDWIARAWTQADDESVVVVPGKPRVPDTSESRARGRELYLSAKAKCTNCHGVTGMGNGPQTFEYETIPGSSEKRAEPGLHDDWGHIVKPRNLKTGIYRGGRRPVDIYRRIFAGIKGAKMPAFGGTVLSDDEIWDLVNYVLSIPYEGKDAAPVSSGGDSEQQAEQPEDPGESQTNLQIETQDQVAQQSGSGEGR